jgi:parallel beta-helix repeat protein
MKMARLRTWKGLSILVALALVLALGAVAVPLAGTVEAQDGNTLHVVPFELQANGTGEAIWTYNVRLTTNNAGDYAAVGFAPVSGLGGYDGTIDSITSLSFGYEHNAYSAWCGPRLLLRLDTNGDGEVDRHAVTGSAAGWVIWAVADGITGGNLTTTSAIPDEVWWYGTWDEATQTYTQLGGPIDFDALKTALTGADVIHVAIYIGVVGAGVGAGQATVGDPEINTVTYHGRIQHAINLAAPTGDTILVHPGKYYETLVINKSLTLQSTDGWQDTTIDPAVQSIIRIEGDVDVTVQGFEITGADSYGIYIGEVFSTVNILDCFIHDNDSDGILVAGSGDVLNIERNIISQNGNLLGGSGLYIQQAWTTVNILDNIIGGWWGGGPGEPVYGGNNEDGIRIDDAPLGSHVTIEDNLIVANGDDGIDFPSVTSVDGSVDIEDNVIGPWTYGGARFVGNGDHGIHVAHVADTGSVNIEGNAISENHEDGINFGDGVSPIYGTVNIVENLIGAWTCYDGDYGYSGSPQRYYGNYGEGIYIYQVGDSGTVTIEHNKISENAWGNYNTGIFIEHIYGEVTIADNEIGAWEDSHGELYLGNAGDGVYVDWVYPRAVLTIGPDNGIKENTDNGIEICNAQPAGAATVTVHHNTIDNNGWNGIQLGALCEVDGDMINHDTVGNNGSNGIELGCRCEVDGATINHNMVTNHLIGIYLAGPSDQNIISDNEIRDNIDGIVVEGNDNQILRNNILNNQGNEHEPSGIHLVSYHDYPISGNIIHCNNIVGNLPYGVSYGGGMTVVEPLGNGLYNWSSAM